MYLSQLENYLPINLEQLLGEELTTLEAPERISKHFRIQASLHSLFPSACRTCKKDPCVRQSLVDASLTFPRGNKYWQS